MRIIIDIPKEYESDYKGDMFKDFFSRVLCDIQDGTMCGNYEKETVEMFLKAFDESTPVDRIVERLQYAKEMPITDMGKSYNNGLDFAITEIKAGGKV